MRNLSTFSTHNVDNFFLLRVKNIKFYYKNIKKLYKNITKYLQKI